MKMTDENMRNLMGFLNVMVFLAVIIEWGGSLVRRCTFDRDDWINNQFAELLIFATVLAGLSTSLAIIKLTGPNMWLAVLAILLGYAAVLALLIWLKRRET
jgi:uncharacterized membrane protein